MRESFFGWSKPRPKSERYCAPSPINGCSECMEQNPLFHRSRLQLASWYAGVMGCILGLCSFGVYHGVAHAYRETIDQGLQSVANALHNTLEPVLQQPGHLQQLAKELSLEFCQTPADCLNKTTVVQRSIPQVVDSVKYYMCLLDRTGKPIALTGLRPDPVSITSTSNRWQTLYDRSGLPYRQISLPLYTQNHLWGYLQLGRSLNDLDQHLAALRLALLIGWPLAMIFIGWSSWWLAGKAMQPVYRSYQQMRQFTTDAAHEFRTPLAAMQSVIEATFRLYGQAQEAPPLELQPLETLAILKRQNTRLSQLVEDLLLLARLEQQDIAGQHHRCSLNDIISDLMEELAFLAIEAKVTLSSQLQTQKELTVLGNEEQLYRLVSNLIVNAIQATPAGGNVTVLLERTEQHALIQVQDTGIGIPREQLPLIFNRFYRVDCDRSRRTGGSGLGLPIAQAIAQAHHGNINVYSQLELGTTFTVRLPLDER